MEKITATIRKTVKSLSTAKGRREHSAFLTERTKNVLELLGGRFQLRWLIGTYAWFESHPQLNVPAEKLFQATSVDMERMTSLSTPSDVMAVFEMPDYEWFGELNIDELYLALDNVQDPGNMGTIIRLADWFGVRTIFASLDCVDAFNPKTVISSMGSIARVRVVSCHLDNVLKKAREFNVPVWGTFMQGESIYNLKDNTRGIIVMGNEGKGISTEVEELVTRKITIPGYPEESASAESLNVAMATAITLAEFRRPKK